MISPTGKKIRNDMAGRGDYGASRGSRNHNGTDYDCVPGQDVVAPISGKVVRIARPYADLEYSGLLIQGRNMAVKLFYFEPKENILMTEVLQGEVIGRAQDISKRYSGDMHPHIHLEIVSLNPDILVSML